eukprot:c9196_g1_i1 orf=2-355(-)
MSCSELGKGFASSQEVHGGICGGRSSSAGWSFSERAAQCWAKALQPLKVFSMCWRLVSVPALWKSLGFSYGARGSLDFLLVHAGRPLLLADGIVKGSVLASVLTTIRLFLGGASLFKG